MPSRGGVAGVSSVNTGGGVARVVSLNTGGRVTGGSRVGGWVGPGPLAPMPLVMGTCPRKKGVAAFKMMKMMANSPAFGSS